MAKPTLPHTIALLGFSEAERSTLSSVLRGAAGRTPYYAPTEDLYGSELVVANADDARLVASIVSAGRTHVTVFIGDTAPEHAAVYLQRPLDKRQLLIELDVLLDQLHSERNEEAIRKTLPFIQGVDLLLPDIDAPGSRPAEAAPPPQGELRSSEGGRRPVLIVDDSAVARTFLAQRLRALNYHVMVAASVEEALDLLVNVPFTIVFMDVMLGSSDGMDGLQICQMIKRGDLARPGATPAVVVTTGATDSALPERAEAAHCDAFLTKPLMAPDFLAALRHVDAQFVAAELP
jgi:CheY-like chemotaxis protein